MPLQCRGGRVILPELLDDAPPEIARRNLKELVRINRFQGGHRILLDRLSELYRPTDRFTFLDIGAASGDMAAAAQRRFPGMEAINTDLSPLHLETARGLRFAGDAFALPLRDLSCDIVHCSLFFHHFDDDAVVRLLREFWRTARRAVIVQDLERHPLPYYFLPATRHLFGWSDIVLHDGPISVEAGFRAPELRQLAERAGLPSLNVRAHRPAFRLSLLAMRS